MRRAIIVAAVAFLGGCVDEVASEPTQAPLVIDGQPDEWGHVALHQPAGHNVAFGIQNDEDRLYLFLATSDERAKRIVQRFGLALWLGEHGNKEKTRGLRFLPLRRPATDSHGDAVAPGPILGKPTAEFQGTLVGSATRVDVGEMSYQGTLSFEVRLPLDDVVVGPDNTVLLGVEVPRTQDRPRASSVRGSGGHRKGRGGGRRGGGGGMGGHSKGSESGKSRHRKAVEPTELLWLRIKLAP